MAAKPSSTPRILHIASWYPSAVHGTLGNFVERHIQAISSLHGGEVWYAAAVPAGCKCAGDMATANECCPKRARDRNHSSSILVLFWSRIGVRHEQPLQPRAHAGLPPRHLRPLALPRRLGLRRGTRACTGP